MLLLNAFQGCFTVEEDETEGKRKEKGTSPSGDDVHGALT